MGVKNGRLLGRRHRGGCILIKPIKVLMYETQVSLFKTPPLFCREKW